MKRIICALMCIVSISSSLAVAAEQPAPEAFPEAEHEEYIFPLLKPEAKLSGGYRYVRLNGSAGVDEYEYLHDSLTIGGEVRAFSFPHRFDLDFDVRNKKDYFGDMSYAYKDILLFRGINRTLYHNLVTIPLIDLNPATADPSVNVRDAGKDYGVDTGISNAFLRIKAPDFPLHFYADGTIVKKDGDQQQRDLIGSGWFNNVVRTSQKRDVDNKTTTLMVGANSHLGPVEVAYEHSERKFSVNGDNVLYDSYSNAGFIPVGSTRLSGLYPHNLLPELKSTSDTIKLHTSYTGAVVASATMTKMDKENRDSGAQADYVIGSGELSWIASRDLAFFFKYRQKETRMDTPNEVEFADLCNPSLNTGNNYRCLIKESVSSIVRTYSASGRYRLTPGITFRGEYGHETITREAADEWFMPSSSQMNAVSLSSDIRFSKSLKMKLNYVYKNIQNPAWNTQPDQAHEGNVSLTWTPAPWLSALASYRSTSERRDNLQFVYEQPVAPFDEVLVDSPDNRKARRDRFLGSVNILPMKNLTATLSFFYLHNKWTEDLAYNDDPAGNLFFDTGVVSQDTVRNVSIDLQYLMTKHTTLSAGVSTTESKGKFHPQSPDLLVPVSVASFSELEMRETIYTVGSEIDLKGGFSLGMNYKYAVLKDIADNPYDDIKDGEAHIIVVMLTKRW